MADKSKLSDLNLTQDEIKRLGEAFKDEKFRELFREYAEEISDPENRRRYEEEIAQLERERGMDVIFIKPEPGYVLKTSVDGDTKAFINISKCDKVDKPNAKREQSADGKNGLMWQIPHSFAPPREDLDKSKQRCKVFDFVVHPDTYRMAESNARFKKMVEDTALDGIERQFHVKLDRKNIKRPNMQFKGVPQATVKRTRNAEGSQNVPDESGLLKDMPYPYDSKTSAEKAKQNDEAYERAQKKKQESVSKQQNKLGPKKEEDAAVPKYSIIHRSEVDMQEYRNARDAKPSTRPKELVIKIELPLLSSAAQANLDIFERRLLLESKTPATYKLDLPLSFPVDESEGSAKFDKHKRTLTVTLPVLPAETPALPNYDDPDVPVVNGESSSPEKLLIEVISHGEHKPEDSSNHVSDEVEKQEPVVNGSRKFTPQISLTLPEFSFTQDAETVSFVLKVKNVVEESIQKTFPSPSDVQLLCMSKGSGGFPIHYSLYLQFGEGYLLAPDHCSVDVTADNMVLLLLKDRSSRGLWDRFMAGLDSKQLKEHLFLTPSNLQLQLEELDAEAEKMEQPTGSGDATSKTSTTDASHNLLVTNMDEKKLTIQISPTKKNGAGEPEEEEDDEYDPPSSAEIEVVHTKPHRNLHGILKQRTVSESSEDVNIDLESPRSGVEDEEELSSSFKRRSVSFSDHIDKATFKTGAAVTSMKSVLKSKRRRQRKWEEKHKNDGSRRRHNSTGSEGSGDDHSHTLSDSYSYSEEEAASHEEDADVQKAAGDVVGAQGNDGPTQLDFRTNKSANKKRKGGGKGKRDPSKYEGSIRRSSSQDDSDHSTERTCTKSSLDKTYNKEGETSSPESTPEEDSTTSTPATEKGSTPAKSGVGKPTEAGEPGSIGSIKASSGSKDFHDPSMQPECTPSKQNGSPDNHSAFKGAEELSAPADSADSFSAPLSTDKDESSVSNDDSKCDPNTNRDRRVAAEVKAKLSAGSKEDETDDSDDDDDDWQDAVEGNAEAQAQADDKPQVADKPQAGKPQAGKPQVAGKPQAADKAQEAEEAQEDSPVKSMLSWEEGKRGGENNEHRTACAFSFNNAVMFDLDDE